MRRIVRTVRPKCLSCTFQGVCWSQLHHWITNFHVNRIFITNHSALKNPHPKFFKFISHTNSICRNQIIILIKLQTAQLGESRNLLKMEIFNCFGMEENVREFLNGGFLSVLETDQRKKTFYENCINPGRNFWKRVEFFVKFVENTYKKIET